jgi:hypothetical protein
MNQLSPQQAFLAMYSFLDAHYQRSKADDVGALLSSMSLLLDGRPADPAVESDWAAAVQAAMSGSVEAAMRLAK